MNDNIRISQADLNMKLEECYAMAVFLAEAVNFIMEENNNYVSDICPVPYGAMSCIRTLADKIKVIQTEI